MLRLYIIYILCCLILCRSSAKAQRSQLDLCVVVFRARAGAAPHPGRLVAHSKRQVIICLFIYLFIICLSIIHFLFDLILLYR